MPDFSQKWSTASLPPRALAVFIDYLVSALVVICAPQLGVAPDYQFLVLLAFGSLYFGVGNSAVMRGQTLGKRLFGLRTVHSPFGDTLEYLSVGRSLLRYCLLYGIAIAAAEVPPLFFRHWEVQGEPRVLELHMLVLLAYTFTNILLALFSADHRGLHDRISGSAVVRQSEELPVQRDIKPRSRSILRCCATGGTLSALAFWALGTVRPEAVRPIYNMRYVIEHRLPFRLTAIEGNRDELYIEGIALGRKRAELPVIAGEITTLLNSLQVISAPKVHLELMAMESAPESQKSYEPSCFVVQPQAAAPADEPCT